MNEQKQLQISTIVKLWFPLALTWMMITVEGPFLSAIIARLSFPTINLAAYGVTFSIAVIMESPIIMLMSAATALVKNSQTYLKLRNFTFILNGAITLIMLLLVLTPAMTFITKTLIGLDDRVSQLTVNALTIMLPWPSAIGFRRFYQGLMIASGKTKFVAYCTIIRICTMAVTAAGLGWFSNWPGVYIGATALSAAVSLEAIAAKLLTLNKSIAKLYTQETDDEPIDYKGIAKFYYPLALTSSISLIVHPLVSFFLGHSLFALESLAVFPVVVSFVFLFRGTFGLSFQEVAIALLKQHEGSFRKVRLFAAVLGGFSVVLLSLVAFTPLSAIWFEDISGLDATLSGFATVPLMILALMPALSVLLSNQRATLIAFGNTQPITIATTLEVVVTIGVLFLCTNLLGLMGAIAAAIALMAGRVIANGFLFFETAKMKRQGIIKL